MPIYGSSPSIRKQRKPPTAAPLATLICNSSASNAYLQQLLYANYYNSLYGGYGYGGYGYGSYGGYGYNNYSNYYTYALLAQMMQNNQSSYSTTTELDKDRYYRGILCGKESARKPTFRVTFAISKE